MYVHVISTASALHLERRSRDDGCPKPLGLHSTKSLFDFYKFNLVFLSVSATSDRPLSACERGERLCGKAVGQDEMQDGRRERNWGLWLMGLDRECF